MRVATMDGEHWEIEMPAVWDARAEAYRVLCLGLSFDTPGGGRRSYPPTSIVSVDILPNGGAIYDNDENSQRR